MFDFEGLIGDSKFVQENMMGPNALRIVDELLRDYRPQQNVRILDLGCGKGLTSIFLAKKYNAVVFASDLWIGATENYGRFKTLALDDRIIPIHAEAHDLPFAGDYFDAIVSVDAYHYFGHEKGYLSTHISPLLKEGGRLFVGIPGLKREFSSGVPPELQPFWAADMNFHSCDWWASMWNEETGISVDTCTELACCDQAWADWLSCDNPHAVSDRDMMKAEAGNYFNIVGISARKV